MASGVAAEPHRDAARDLGFGTLDTPYRRWLRGFGAFPAPEKHRDRRKREVHRVVGDLGADLLDGTGLAAWEGAW
ncbi:hypothetical protein [Streptomyces sp. NPDC058045]|uniref:hypothetical protein n=1 Tax=Streptomyces sp. NPDC058045 TaxID=3346311 RepID=UPI0036E6A0E9